jgi:ankyrin repeat protein
MSQKIINCNNMVSLNNTLGTCWNIAILAILFYSDETGPEVQNKLKLPIYLSAMEHATNLVNEAEQQIRAFLPSYINFDEKKKDIIFFIKYVIERFNTKINIVDILNSDRPKYLGKHLPNVSMKEIGLQRQISGDCEEQLTRYFFNIFDKEVDYGEYGGNYYDDFSLLNLLSIILLHKKINIKNLLEYIDEYHKIEYTELNKPSLGFMFSTGEHAVGLFKCNNKYKFVDNENIINFNFNKLLERINELNTSEEPYQVLFDDNGIYIQSGDTQYRFNDKYREEPFIEPKKLSDFYILSFHNEIESESDCYDMREEESVWNGQLEIMLMRQDLEQFETTIKEMKDINKFKSMFSKLLEDYETNKNFIMILMKYGFNAEVYIDKKMFTPLEVASKKGYLDLVKFILENKLGKAYINKKNEEVIRELQTALSLAIKNNKEGNNTELKSALKIAKDKYKETKKASDNELTSALILAILNNQLEVIKILLEGGVDPNTVLDNNRWDNDGEYKYNNPLILASKLDIKMVDLLLENGAKINKHDFDDGNTALHHAIKSNKIDIVKRLIKKGVDINYNNSWNSQSDNRVC